MIQGMDLRRFAGKNEYYHSEKEPMRPGQQNRRSRNRGNRKGPNPLSRNYESNGPDVKIRGNAQHIADKYAQLARDAMASGDRVMAENYLQHAEHYNRIIAAAQAQAGIQQSRERDDDNADDVDDNVSEGSEGGKDTNGSGPQPVIDGVPAEVAYDENASQANSGDTDAGEDQRPRRSRSRRTPRQDNGAEAVASDDGEDKPAKTRKPRASRSRSKDEGEDAAPAAEDGSAIGWLAAAGQD